MVLTLISRIRWKRRPVSTACARLTAEEFQRFSPHSTEQELAMPATSVFLNTVPEEISTLPPRRLMSEGVETVHVLQVMNLDRLTHGSHVAKFRMRLLQDGASRSVLRPTSLSPPRSAEIGVITSKSSCQSFFIAETGSLVHNRDWDPHLVCGLFRAKYHLFGVREPSSMTPYSGPWLYLIQ
jgi:hypothetical protein